MADQTSIYLIRLKLGNNRQPSYAPDILHFDSIVRTLGKPHPYSLDDKQIAQLLSIPTFAQGGQGSICNIPAAQVYLFHLSSVHKVVNNTTWHRFPPGFSTSFHQNRTIFEYLRWEHDAKKDWLRLSDYAHGSLSGFRGFTWWTSLKLLPQYILCGAHSLGIPNDWIPIYALLLRCPVKYINSNKLARIPTTVDGYISEIFHPTIGANSPLTGMTVNLDGYPRNPLSHGYAEFTVMMLDVNELEFQPILIDNSVRMSHDVLLNSVLRNQLEDYYSKL